MTNLMKTATQREQSRHDRRHSEDLPEWMTKKQVAVWLQISQRQVELLTAKGRLPKPTYLGQCSPRWKRPELLASLEANQAAK